MFYSTKGTVINESAEIDFDNIQESKHDISIAGAMRIVAENEANYNMIMEAVGISELQAIEEGGIEAVNEAFDVGAFFKKVKAFFMSIIAKIAELVKKFLRLVDSWVMSDKEFINKYRKDILAVKNLSDFEYKGFKFTTENYLMPTDKAGINTIVEIATTEGGEDSWKSYAQLTSIDTVKIEDVVNSDGSKTDGETRVRKFLEKIEDKMEDSEDKMRARFVKDATSVESSEFANELFKNLRDGEDTKQDIDKVSPSDMLNTVSAYADVKKKAEKAFKDIKKIIDDQIKELTKIENSIKTPVKGSDGNVNTVQSKINAGKFQLVSKMTSIYRIVLNMMVTANGAYMAALKDENRQAKAVCVKLMNYSPKKEGFEHFTDDTVIGESAFAGIKFK